MSQTTPNAFGIERTNGVSAQQPSSSQYAAAPINGESSQSSETQHFTPQLPILPPPGFDMSALAGISPQQLAVIAQLFQSGALPLPPASPLNGSGPSFPVKTTGQNSRDEQSAHQPGVAHGIKRAREDLGSDKEEGEVDDDGLGARAPKRSSLQHSPGMRKKGVSPGLPSLHRGSPDSQTLRAGTTIERSEFASTLSGAKVISTGDRNSGLKAFLRELHSAGYRFDEIVREVGSANFLRRLYTELGIPVDDNISAPNVATAQTNPTSLAPEMRRKAAAPKPAAAPPKIAPLQGRGEYLAKLQAFRSQKRESKSLDARKEETEGRVAELDSRTAVSAGTNPVLAQTQPEASQTQAHQRTKVTANTELIRQRLEALRAKTAKQNEPAPVQNEEGRMGANVNANAMTDVAQSVNGIGGQIGRESTVAVAGADDINHSDSERPGRPTSLFNRFATFGPLATQAQQAYSPSSPALPVRPSSALPGLFMNSPVPAWSDTPDYDQNSTRHLRTVQSDHVQVEPSGRHTLAGTVTLSPHSTTLQQGAPTTGVKSGSNTPHHSIALGMPNSVAEKPAFGRSRDSEVEESLIITVSDDEDDEIDSEQGSKSASTAGSKVVGDASNDSIHRSHYPQSAATSLPGTPSQRTQSSDLQRKLQELEEARRLLARAESRQKLGWKKKLKSPSAEMVGPDPDSERSASKLPAFAENIPSGPSGPSGEAQSLSSIKLVEGAHTDPERVISRSLTQEQQKERLAQRMDKPEHDHATTMLAQSFEDSASTTLTTLAPKYPPGNEVPENGVQIENTTQSIVAIDHEESGGVAVKDSRRHESESPAPGSSSEMSISRDSSEQPDSVVDENQMAAVEEEDFDDVYLTTQDDAKMSLPHNSTDVHREQSNVSARKHKDDSDTVDAQGVRINMMDPPEEPSEYEETNPQISDSQGYASSEMGDDTDSSDESKSNSSAMDQSPAESLAGVAGHSMQITDRAENLGSAPQEVSSIPSSTADQITSTNESNEPAISYSLYQSPLFRFKDYRYHPTFTETVAGGFKSLTYNHRIDPFTPLCPFEAVGGKCNDPACQFQHFASMEISDLDTLRLIGTDRIPAFTPEDEQKWKDGLTAVVQHLRTSGIGDDVQSIAKRIAEFRREFIGDPSRVLHLAP